MIKVGVTGAIGSGKTTFCNVWQQLGARIFYADDEAKKLMSNDSRLKAQLKKAFGENTYNRDGTLNKPHLIEQAFQAGRVEELNNLVHPAVAAEFKRVCSIAEKDGVELIIKEAALLLRKGRPEELDIIVIIKSDQAERISRVVERDSTDEKSVLQRDARQPDFDKLEHFADYVIENSTTIENLRKKAAELFYTISGKL